MKPFNAGDKGFRDTLLWFNILELAEKYHCVSFISQNTSDFSDGLKELHPSLMKEVKEKIPKGFKLFYFKDFQSFLTQFGGGDQKIQKDLIYDSLYSNTLYGLDIEKWLDSELIDLINQCELDAVSWTSIPYWAEGPMIVEIEEILSFCFNWIKLKDQKIEFYLEVALIGYFDCVTFTGFPKEIKYLKQVIRYSKSKKLGPPLHLTLRSEGKFLVYFSYDIDTRKVQRTEIMPIQDNLESAQTTLEALLSTL